jgi:hypothetical protein
MALAKKDADGEKSVELLRLGPLSLRDYNDYVYGKVNGR